MDGATRPHFRLRRRMNEYIYEVKIFMDDELKRLTNIQQKLAMLSKLISYLGFQYIEWGLNGTRAS